MADIELDFAALRAARRRVQNSLETFSAAGRVGDDVAGLVGEYRLAGKVRDFAGNWDYNRGTLVTQLEFLRDALDAVVDTLSEVDEELARTAGKAETETTDGDGG